MWLGKRVSENEECENDDLIEKIDWETRTAIFTRRLH